MWGNEGNKSGDDQTPWELPVEEELSHVYAFSRFSSYDERHARDVPRLATPFSAGQRFFRDQQHCALNQY